jgi:hypothetical protein
LQPAATTETELSRIRTRHATIWYLWLRNDLLDGLCKRVDNAVEQVGFYLRAAAPQELKVFVSDGHGLPVAYRDSAAIVIPAKRLPDRAAVVHELTHIIAGAGQDDGDVLDEGLAVYLQRKFGGPGDRSFPAGERDLHEETVRLMAQCKLSFPLALTAHVRREIRRGPKRTLAYLENGSFTQFLVDTYGIDALMRVYRGASSWTEVFGCEMEVLEKSWIELLSRIKDRMLRQPP